MAGPSLSAVEGATLVQSVGSGIVGDAVRSANGRAVNAHGSVLDAVEGAANGPAVSVRGIVVDTVEDSRLRSDTTDLGRTWTSDIRDLRGLTSFSLKLASDVRGSGMGSGPKVYLETFVRNNTLIIEMQVLGMTNDRVREWQVQTADGRPLPAWLGPMGRDVLTGQRPVNAERLNLRVTAILRDGSTITNEVRLDPVTGEMKPLSIGRSGSVAPPTFFEQLDRGYMPYDAAEPVWFRRAG